MSKSSIFVAGQSFEKFIYVLFLPIFSSFLFTHQSGTKVSSLPRGRSVTIKHLSSLVCSQSLQWPWQPGGPWTHFGLHRIIFRCLKPNLTERDCSYKSRFLDFPGESEDLATQGNISDDSKPELGTQAPLDRPAKLFYSPPFLFSLCSHLSFVVPGLNLKESMPGVLKGWENRVGD